MCLGIPGKITKVNQDGLMRMGKVDFGGVAREVCLAYVPEAGVGDYVIVHVGFAISQLDEVEAQETLQLMEEIGILGKGSAVQSVSAVPLG
ncbi:MAG: hydrogenase assembly protein HypC [Chloroflexi bacterium]|nr:MAG: hydrogenase assembly protein HypC [Chloroflexota bacterium]